jgi:hypothetical protein
MATNPFAPPPNPFKKEPASNGGMSYANPSGKGGVEVSPTGQKKSVGYVSGGGGIYTPPAGTESQNQISLTKDTGTGYNPATRVQEGTTAAKNIAASKLVTAQSSVSNYNQQTISKAPLSNWGQAAKGSIGNLAYNVKLAFGRKTSGEYKPILNTFEYTSPVSRIENIHVIGGDASQFKFPKQETIMNAQYSTDVDYKRIGSGPAITKYGETALVLGGSFVAPTATSGYLMVTGLEKFSKGKNVEGLLRYGAGTIPVASELRNIAKPMGDITKIRIEELTGQRAKLVGVETYNSPQGGMYNIILSKQAPYAEQTTVFTTATKVTGEKTFSIPNIRAGFTRTTVQDWWTGKPITTTTKFTAVGKGEIVDAASLFSKGSSVNIPENVVKSTGTGYYTESGTVTNFLGKTSYKKGNGFTPLSFGGLTETTPESGFYRVAGLKPEKIRIYRGENTGKTSLITDVSQYGFIQKYAEPEVSKVFSSGGKGTVQSFKSSSFTPAGFTEQVSQTSSKSVSGQLTSSSMKEITAFKSVQSTAFSTKQFMETSTQQRVFSIPGLSFNQASSSSQKNKIGIISPPILSNAPIQKQPQMPGVITKLGQPPAQIEKGVLAVAPVIPAVPKMNAAPYVPPSFTVPPIIPWLPKFDFNESVSKRSFKGKPRYKYVPSFEALVFNIRGKQPRGMETGARTRPIPKGYSFSYKSSPINFNRGFKMPKFNFSIFGKRKKRK